jgi:glutamate dehydrogenase
VQRWDDIEALVGRVEPVVVDELLSGVDRLVESLSRWYLANAPGMLGRAIESHREPFRRLAESLRELLTDASRAEGERYTRRLVDGGVPEPVARRHALQQALVHGPNIITVAEHTGRPLEDVARIFFLVGEAMYIDWLEGRLRQLAATSRWQRWAAQTIQEEMLFVRSQIAERVVGEGGDLAPEQAVGSYVESRSVALGRLSRFERSLAMEDANDLSAMTVALRYVRALAN